MITELQVENALKYLHESAGTYGEVCGLVELQSHNIKMYKSMAFLEATGTVAERDAHANMDQRVIDAVEAHKDAVVEKMTIQTRRQAMSLKIEVWRTQSASNRTKML